MHSSCCGRELTFGIAWLAQLHMVVAVVVLWYASIAEMGDWRALVSRWSNDGALRALVPEQSNKQQAVFDTNDCRQEIG
jgi:hypothetical protein